MYKKITEEEYKKYLGLPKDYKVDMLIAMGHWDRKGEQERFKKIIKELSSNKVTFEIIQEGFLKNTLICNVVGKRIWFDVFYGPALLSEITHLASLFGSKENLLLGSCGYLSTTGSFVDVIIPTASDSTCSSSSMYSHNSRSPRYPSDNGLSDKIASRLTKEGLSILRGPLTTCEAMLAEDETDIKEWAENGYVGVDMESATFFSVSNHFGVPSAAILRTGDNLIESERVIDVSYIQRKKKDKDIIMKKMFCAALANVK